MGERAETDGTAATLIFKHPAEAEESDYKRYGDLNVLRHKWRSLETVGKVQRNEIDSGKQETELDGEKHPSP